MRSREAATSAPGTSTIAVGSTIGWQALAVGLVLASAALLRFVALATQPGGLYPDEAVEGISALNILANPLALPVFFPNDGGREALFAWIVAATFRVFGASVEALRGSSALLGVLGVVGIGWFGFRFGRVAGIAAMAWAAGSAWLVAVSRDGFRNGIVLPLEALALGALVRWVDQPTRWRATLAGALVALAGFYTYTPMRILPVVVVAWIAYQRWTNRRAAAAGGSLGLNGRWMAGSWLAVSAPILLIAAQDPVSYLGRTATVAIVPSVGLPTIVDHTVRTLGMFALTGDPNPRHDVNAWPILIAPFALLGLVGLIRLIKERRQPRASLTLLSLIAFTLPPLLAGEGSAPHFLRALGLAVPIAIVVGVGTASALDWTRARLVHRVPSGAPSFMAAFGAVAFFAVAAVATGVAYLSRSPGELYTAYRYDLAALATMADHGAHDTVILSEFDGYTVQFLDASSPPTVVQPGSRIAPTIAPGDRVFALDPASFASAGFDQATVAGARPIAWDPNSNATVWVVMALP